jgi:transaldolase
LWGSTGTKNPKYSDIKYVEELIGPESVNTLPETTIEAFRDHGQAKVTVTANLEDSEKVFRELGASGIDIDEVTDQLENEGVKSFSDSFFSLLGEIARKRDSFLSKMK